MSPKARVVLGVSLMLAVCQPVFAATITEFAGPNMVVSPQFYGAANTGTYYHPTAVEANGYVFLFVQGGQFSSSTSPVTWCEGDKVILYRAPYTAAGINNQFMPQGRISPCESVAGQRIHWTMTSAYHSAANGMVSLIAERQAVTRDTNAQISSTIWLFRGTFSAQGSAITGWQYYKLFDTVAGGPARIESFVTAADTTRTAPMDGFSHELLRGFARKSSNVTVEFRIDISNAYCGSSSSPDICSHIELKKNGVWTSVVGGQLNFVPDSLISSFRPNNVVQRGGQLELWGAAIVTGNDVPCATSNPAGQFVWYVINPATFALGAQNQVVFTAGVSVRPMPAEPHTTRMGVDVVTLPGGARQYLLSGHNDDQACSLTNAFVGIDIVTTRIQ